MVERFLGKKEVPSSILGEGSLYYNSVLARVPKWTTGAVCKTAGFAFIGSNPIPGTLTDQAYARVAQWFRAPVL